MAEVCIRCLGEGSYLGNGMIRVDCNLCNGDDYEQKIEAPSLDKINRNSKSYQKAIKDIMDINPDISRKEAIKMFDEAYIKG
jgi:hypothetical protein